MKWIVMLTLLVGCSGERDECGLQTSTRTGRTHWVCDGEVLAECFPPGTRLEGRAFQVDGYLCQE